MPLTVILNPYSNRWQAQSRRPSLEKALAAAGLDYTLLETQSPRHATQLALQAISSGNTPVVAAGGDGLVSEVMSGIMRSEIAVPLGVFPLGGGNSFADMLNIPRDLTEAAKTIAEGCERIIDIGRVNDHYFDNNSGVGLEPIVSIQALRLTKVRGAMRYILAAVLSILRGPSWHMKLQWDGGHYEGQVTLVSVGNNRRTGGAFYMTPNAQPDDGLLDFVFVPQMSRLRLLQLMPRTLKGTHIQDPVVQMHRSTYLTITADPGSPIQADGEVIALDAKEIHYGILPSALKVIVPRNSWEQPND